VSFAALYDVLLERGLNAFPLFDLRVQEVVGLVERRCSLINQCRWDLRIPPIRFGKNTAATGRRLVVSGYCPQPGLLP
jgi:hypothetical protein